MGQTIAIWILIGFASIGIAAIIDRLGNWLESRRKSVPAVTPVDPGAHFHDLIPIDAQLLPGEHLAYPQTVCLKRCTRCKMHYAGVYAGVWTITDFLKTESDARGVAAEVAELRRMAS